MGPLPPPGAAPRLPLLPALVALGRALLLLPHSPRPSGTVSASPCALCALSPSHGVLAGRGGDVPSHPTPCPAPAAKVTLLSCVPVSSACSGHRALGILLVAARGGDAGELGCPCLSPQPGCAMPCSVARGQPAERWSLVLQAVLPCGKGRSRGMMVTGCSLGECVAHSEPAPCCWEHGHCSYQAW